MKKFSKYKVDPAILILLVVFAFISVLSIMSAETLLDVSLQGLHLKQIFWYVLGFILAYFIMFIGNDYIYKHIWILYGIGIVSLAALLIFAPTISNAKCWFVIPGVGNIQPSEFMKIILIITLATMINKFNEENPKPSVMDEFKFLIQVLCIVLVPSFLTFMQPDTGVVLIYLLITLTMLFISGIRYRWFIIAFGLIGLLLASVIVIYFTNEEIFINIFGTDFFLRIDRLLDWSSKTGFQLENGMSAIGSGGITGTGFKNTPVYFPEAQTDFIFAVFASNFGFLGSTILLSLIVFFDTRIINLAIKNDSNINKYVTAGILGMLIYQQFQNIGMTIGVMPITGITLPFVSYGGSSLLSYMIMAGIIFNISNETIRYKNKKRRN
jgi:Bacterial cell division membrane protein